ncbi:flagellar export chaperone FliS [Enterobacter pasteurii]|uniref:flagellar export chaperone FliS n=1 Tax=Enterobacter pasteurii TaxID=3029761 RepID=UPI002AC3444E|nr:flagellar export chaperone FliS [Enterobacter pasteurii]
MVTSALDFEKGGELALSLANLYDYCVYRLYDASHKLSVDIIDEVETILGNIQDGWQRMGQGA